MFKKNNEIKTINKFLILTFVVAGILLVNVHLIAADSQYTWAKSFGGSGEEDLWRTLDRASDGGYVMASYTTSFGFGQKDILLVKVSEDGTIEWQKTYGSGGNEAPRTIKQTSDGGYVIAARASVNGGDALVIKLSSTGKIQWQKAYGGPGDDIAHYIIQTSDGGYLIGGFTKSSSFTAGEKDFFVVKLSSTGNVEWQKSFGGSGDDVIRVLKQTSNGDYLVSGFTHSFGAGRGDILIIKLDPNGDIIWQKTYGGTKFEEVCCILEYPDGYLVMEQTSSFGGTQGWIFKIDEDGGIIWQKTYGGDGFDELSSAQITPDGGFIVAGETTSFGVGDGKEDFWLLKFSPSGNIQWEKRYGGSGQDEAEMVALTPEGGYVLLGKTASFGTNVDLWSVKTDSNGNVKGCIQDVTAAGTPTSSSVKNSNAVPSNVNTVVHNTNVSVRNTNYGTKDISTTVGTQCAVTPI